MQLNYDITLCLTINSICQYKCFYCYNKKYNNKNINLDYIKKLNKFLDSENLKFRILLLGGEPTLHLNLKQIIQTFENNNCINVIELYTNNKFIPLYLRNKNFNKLKICCSYHPSEIKDDNKFIENALNYNKNYNTIIQINMLPQYRDRINNVVNKLKNKIEIYPNYLYTNKNNNDILIEKYFNADINDYLENKVYINNMTLKQAIKKSYKNYNCVLSCFDIDDFNIVQNCTFNKINLIQNPAFFKDLKIQDLITKCKYNKCKSPCYAEMIKY